MPNMDDLDQTISIKTCPQAFQSSCCCDLDLMTLKSTGAFLCQWATYMPKMNGIGYKRFGLKCVHKLLITNGRMDGQTDTHTRTAT